MARGWLAGMAVLTAVLAVGCSAGGGADPASPGSGPGARPVANAALNAAADVDAQLQDARNRLYDKCMAAKGFTVHPQHQPADPSRYTAKEPPSPRPESPDDARRYGYRIAEGPPAEPTEKAVRRDPFDDQPQEVRDRYAEALTGPGNPNRSEGARAGDKERDVFVMPDGSKKFVYRNGCEPEVDRAVLGDVKRYIELRYAGSSGLDRAVYQAAQGDAEVASARAAWVACMSAKGYPAVGDPVEAAKQAELYYQNVDQRNPDAVRQARDKEVAQAVAHADCGQQTGVDEKLRAAWHREYAGYLVAHETDLVAWQQFAREALTRAQQMLAS